MAHVIIVGASTGGLPAAYEMRDLLSDEHQVTVVSNTPVFHFVPSNPWVAVGRRQREQVSFNVEPYLNKKNITFSSAGVSEIKPESNTLVLADGETLSYDYLIVATGPKLAFDEIEGLGPEGHTQSICTLDHAESAHLAWQRFVKKPGPIVIGAVQGASCYGPAYEFALIINDVLRKAKIRDQVPITFVTSEPYIGHLGLGGVGDSKGVLESEFRQNDIKWITNAKVTKVEQGNVFVDEVNDQAETIKSHELAFDYSMLLPAFKGIDCVANLGDEVVNPRGFIKVDEFQRNPKYPNIYGVGVCIAIPPVGGTPLAVGVPKTGYMIESMARAAVENIKDAIAGEEISAKAAWNALCFADMGSTGVAFVAKPQIPPRNTVWMKKGRWVHWAKVGFEKYFIHKMKKGSAEPAFEKFFLKIMDFNKLK
ncbi:MAG: pyridine nucleotide-disulfide oxidoreductase [Gammaproteobacteria bacterium]|nr:MAG: pyridine nucleotide-disulfide oxidoreductase [Gammaproteobacteria bacterium]